MNDIFIRKVNDSSVQLEGISKLGGRSGMKLNIYINALNDVIVKKGSDNIELIFSDCNEHTITKILKDLITFLTSCSAEISLDLDISDMLKRQEDYQADASDRVKLLKAIKSEDGTVSEQYKEFCGFCDSVLVIKLRDYQYKSAFLLGTGMGGFDFSVPGSGKTIISYVAYRYLKEKGVVNRLFVVGPISAVNAWNEEYVTCFGIEPEFENLSGEITKNCKLYLEASPKYHKEITFINLDKIRLLKKEISYFLSQDGTLLIIDEGHKIKNPNASVTEAAVEISKTAAARIILTGTPMPNGYEDLYSLTIALDPYEQILPYRYNQLKTMTSNGASSAEISKLHESIDPFYSRISKRYLIEKGELLPATYETVLCKMSDDQCELYQKLNDFCGKLSDDIDEDFLMNLKKAVLIRKMQISANPALLKNSIVNSMDELKAEYAEYAEREDADINLLAKADKELMEKYAASQIVKIVNEFERGARTTNKNRTAVDVICRLVSEGKKVLVWDVFVNNMTVLKKMIEDGINNPVELVNGTVSGEERQEAIRRFRSGDSMVLLANPATLAESISLHRVCQNAVYVNRNFNAAQFIQSKDRIHRINMPAGTTAHYYFIENTDSVDEAISEKLELKENRMLEILDAEDITVGGAEMEDSSIMSDQDVLDTYMR